MDSIDEEIETFRQIRELFLKLQFKDSHEWVMRWMRDFYRPKL